MTSATARANAALTVRPPVVMIGTPCYAAMTTAHFTNSLLATGMEMTRHGITMAWCAVVDSALVHVCRTTIVSEFMAQADATHLIFIDADMSWHPADVGRLLSHDVDVVCGIYPGKVLPLRWDFDPLPHPAPPGPGGLVEIEAAFTGFLCIRRQALLRMAEAYPERRLSLVNGIPITGFDFFPTALDGRGHVTSEDRGFSRLWRAIGGQVWADPTIRLKHHGQHAFEGDPAEAFAPAVSAAAA